MNNEDLKTPSTSTNFIRNIIEEDLARGANLPRYWCGHPAPYSEQLEKGEPDHVKIRTRFPPEPNGYLHIGHAKSICLNFGLARDYGGYCHMRFDDTNPVKEDQEYVDGILDSVRWLGFDWVHEKESNLYFASSYFEYMYEFAEHLVKTGYAYVDEQTAEEMKANRGTLHEPGRNSPYRDRSVEENLRLFREMRDGKHPEGSMVLRAKIDMASPNINLRDPTIYRIRFAEHHATGNKWCIYPMYTFAHPIEDSLENITHSICTLEFEDQRAFYDWSLERIVPVLRTPQFEEAKQIIASMASGGDNRAMAFVCAAKAAEQKLGHSIPEERVRDIFAKWESIPDSIDDHGVTTFFALLKEYPEKKFLVYDTAIDYSDGKHSNCFSFEHRAYESSFLAGALAATLTSSSMPNMNPEKIIGFVGGMENASISDFLVGYIQGALYVDPECKVLISYVGSFTDTATAKEMTIAECNKGADIVFAVAGGSSLGVLDGTAEKGVYSFGVDMDQYEALRENNPEVAENIITSVVKHLDVTIANMIRDITNDDIEWGSHVMVGLKEGAIGLAENSRYKELVAPKTIEFIDSIADKISSGEINVETAIGMTTEQINAYKERVML